MTIRKFEKVAVCLIRHLKTLELLTKLEMKGILVHFIKLPCFAWHCIIMQNNCQVALLGIAMYAKVLPHSNLSLNRTV